MRSVCSPASSGAATVVGAFSDGVAVDHRGDPELRETRRCARHMAGVALSAGRSVHSGSGLLWISLGLLFIVGTFGLGITDRVVSDGAVGVWFIYGSCGDGPRSTTDGKLYT
jgi:hypothetical protein